MAKDNKVQTYINFLKVLAATDVQSHGVRKAILKSSDLGLIKILASVAHNILIRHLKLSHHYKIKLKEYSSVIRRLGAKATKPRQRRKVCYSNPDAVGLMLKAVIEKVVAVLEIRGEI